MQYDGGARAGRIPSARKHDDGRYGAWWTHAWRWDGAQWSHGWATVQRGLDDFHWRAYELGRWAHDTGRRTDGSWNGPRWADRARRRRIWCSRRWPDAHVGTGKFALSIVKIFK